MKCEERWDRRLLGDDDPEPVELVNEAASSPFFLTCEHAGRAVPGRLNGLGLHNLVLQSEEAFDIGAEGVARHLSRLLPAPLVLQPYSRLVIDCNRSESTSPPTTLEFADVRKFPDLMVAFDSGLPGGGSFVRQDVVVKKTIRHTVPGNQNMCETERRARIEEIHRPYHQRIRNLLDARLADRGSTQTVVVSVHSMGPIYRWKERPWDVSLVYDPDGDTRLAKTMLSILRQRFGEINVGDAEPYRLKMYDDSPMWGFVQERGFPHVAVEIRQDGIVDNYGQENWATMLSNVLWAALYRW